MPYRRHSARMFEPSCLASITNSRRNDMADISPHGIHPLPHELRDAWKMCSPCPRTPVHHVSGLYRRARVGGRIRGSGSNRRGITGAAAPDLVATPHPVPPPQGGREKMGRCAPIIFYLLMAAALLVARPALAHAVLLESVPGDSAVLAAAPAEVLLR